MLERRDRERYRNALKDLADYEIYKQVMEAAMVRLQEELEVCAKENKALKESRVQEQRNIRKQKKYAFSVSILSALHVLTHLYCGSFSEKYSRDLSSTRKKLEEAELRVSNLEKQVKVLTKERDAAVATLAQVKTQGGHRDSQFKKAAEVQVLELEELKKRLEASENRVRDLTLDKESIMHGCEHELQSLREAHSKALEMLMSYQETLAMVRVGKEGIESKR